MGWIAGQAMAQGVLDASNDLGQAPPIESADGEVAFHLVEGWVRAGRVPGDEALPSAPLTGVFGVYVTLREDGRRLGSGSALREDLADTIDAEGPAVDVALLLAQATRAALREVERTHKRQAVEQRITDEDLLEQSLRGLHGRLMIDVQIGHHLTTLSLAANGQDDAVFAQFVPGFHGLRMTGAFMPEGDLVWPANALARNTSPRSQLVQLLTRQGFEEEDIPVIARPAGPGLERFEVVHFVQVAPNQPPRQLIRGNTTISGRAIDEQRLLGMVERIARHLDSKIETLNDGTSVLRGPYHPSYNQIEPELARVRQGSLACFAMLVQSNAEHQRSPGNRLSRVRAERAVRTAETLVTLADRADGQVEPMSVALLLLALCESPVEVDEQMRDGLGATLMALRLNGGGFRAQPGDDERASRAAEAIITAALASWYVTKETPDPAVRQAVWQSMNELVQVNHDDEEGAGLVDLTWLAVAYSRAGRQIAGAVEDPLAQDKLTRIQDFFADQLQLLIDQQVPRGTLLLGPNDVAGGFVTYPGVRGAPPDPSWDSAMPLLVIASLLRDDAIVAPDETYGPLLSAQFGGGFIARLLLTNANAYYVRDIDAASGGVRRSLWDNRLDLDCSAVALIALSELQTSLRLLEDRDLTE